MSEGPKTIQFRPDDFAEIVRLAELMSEKLGIKISYTQAVMRGIKLLSEELEQ